METNLCAGGRAFMKVGRNIVEVRVLEKIGTCWQVSTRTGKTMLARELAEDEVASGPGPVAALALVPNRQVPRTGNDAEPAATATSETTTIEEAATAPVSAEATPAPTVSQPKGMSLLNAAAAILERSASPMPVKAIIDEAKAQGLWMPSGGKTPEQTLYSAIVREMKAKGDAARFRKEDRGRFSFVR